MAPSDLVSPFYRWGSEGFRGTQAEGCTDHSRKPGAHADSHARAESKWSGTGSLAWNSRAFPWALPTADTATVAWNRSFFLSHTHQCRHWLTSVLTNTHSWKWARYIQMCEHDFTTATQKYICSPALCKVSVPSHLYKPQTHTDSTRKHILSLSHTCNCTENL